MFTASFGTFAAKPWAKALTALLLAILTAVATAVGTGAIGDIDGYGWVKVALVVLGGTALTQLVDNFAPALGGAIKALIGAATAGLTAWTVAYENEDPVLNNVSQGEWLVIAIAVVGALSVVYQVSETGTKTVAVQERQRAVDKTVV